MFDGQDQGAGAISLRRRWTRSIGAPVNVSVQIDNVADLFSASQIRVKYDASLLK